MIFPTDALKFLTAIFPEDVIDDESLINFRGLARGTAPREEFVPSTASLNANGTGHAIARWNENEGRSVYVAPGLRRGSDGTKDGVVGIAAFWVDIDAKMLLGIKDRDLTPQERQDGKTRARDILAERLPATLQPSMIIDTGGGLQAWWLLKEFAPISDDHAVATLEGYLKGLTKHLGADPAVAQLAALMRVPGFINHKYADTPVATILEFDRDRRFQPSDFADYVIERPTDHARPLSVLRAG